jgi:hypothetical protein
MKNFLATFFQKMKKIFFEASEKIGCEVNFDPAARIITKLFCFILPRRLLPRKPSAACPERHQEQVRNLRTSL